MPDTRTIRLETIAKDYCDAVGVYTAANSIRAIAYERDALRKEVERLREVIRQNGLRWGYTNEDIDKVLANTDLEP